MPEAVLRRLAEAAETSSPRAVQGASPPPNGVAQALAEHPQLPGAGLDPRQPSQNPWATIGVHPTSTAAVEETFEVAAAEEPSEVADRAMPLMIDGRPLQAHRPLLTAPIAPASSHTVDRSALWNEFGSIDLDALSDSIKRILDEEARRHGIDV